MRSLIEDVKKQVGVLEARIVALSQGSQDAVALKNRSTALAALRSKKAAEAVLSQRMDTLFQLEQVFESIKQASDQITMLQVMKDSAGVLRGLNARVGSVHDVEDALEGLKEEMGKVEDIGSAINEAGQASSVVNVDELDKELDALLRQRRSEEEDQATESTKRRLASIQNTPGIDQKGANQSELWRNQALMAPKPTSDPSLAKEIKTFPRLSLDDGKQIDPVSQSRERKESTIVET